MWLEAVTKHTSASSTHIGGSSDECLLVTAKRKNWLLHSQFSLPPTAVTHKQEKTLCKMLLALRIAMNSDKLLLCNSQKEHRKTNMKMGIQPPRCCNFQMEFHLECMLTNINTKWSWFPVDASHLQHQQETHLPQSGSVPTTTTALL